VKRATARKVRELALAIERAVEAETSKRDERVLAELGIVLGMLNAGDADVLDRLMRLAEDFADTRGLPMPPIRGYKGPAKRGRV